MSETPTNPHDPALQTVFIDCLQAMQITVSETMLASFNRHYLPLAQWVAEQHQQQPLIIGINGAQGSGKSSLSEILAQLLHHGFNKQVCVLSIDDLYKTRQQRQQMAQSHHPLFASRGVPGTHDVAMGIDLLQQLKQGAAVQLPRFDKASDDRAHLDHWQTIAAGTDIVLFEGWCVGASPEPEQALAEPLNTLERYEDSDGHWRQQVNRTLAEDYPPLFALIDKLIMLKIPGFEKVLEWRGLQEEKLKQSHTSAPHAMDNSDLQRFIMHFERLTRHTLNEMPSRADIVIEIDHQHHMKQLIFKTA